MRVWLALAPLLVAGVAGCLDNTGGDGADRDILEAAAAPLASYLHSLSEPVEGQHTITEHYRTSVPGPLGLGLVELDTWIIRPDIDASVPVVLEVTPYYGGGEPVGLGRVAEELIPRGYAVGVSSVRGTGNSGGCFTQGGPQEAKDTAAVVEHMAAQPWANGHVGIIGVSYPGTTPQDVWVEAPPSLKTIVPISGISDLYKYNFVNGVPIDIQGLAFNTYYWVLVGAAPVSIAGGMDPTDLATIPGAVIGEVCTDQVDVQQGGATSTLDGNKDEYWQARDFAAEYWNDGRDVERASVFYIHGLQDWNVKPHNMEDWLDAVWDSGVPMKVWLGQWHHAWPSPSSDDALCTIDQETNGPFLGACRADWWNQTLVAWFDHFLKGIDTGILDAPPVQVQDDDGRWRHEERWPPADVEWLEFAFAGDALVPVGDGSGEASFGIGPTGPPLPVLGGDPSVTFVSEPLGQNITVSGMPVFEGTVTATGIRQSFVISLGERLESGEDRYVNFAAQSLNHALSPSAGMLSVAGVPLDVSVDFFPQEDVLHEGSRIVVTFAGDTVGGPGPSLIPLNDPGTVTIDLSDAVLRIPVDPFTVYEDPQPYVEEDE